MRRLILVPQMLCLTMAACNQSSPPAGNRDAAGPAASAQVGDFTVGAPLRHGNLTIFPVLSKTAREMDRFITLEEGLQAGTVEVLEVGANSTTERDATVIDPEPASAPAQPPIANADLQSNAPIQQDALAPPGSGQAGNEVNRLMVVNRSDKPLYLMPGEVIVGGSQDRTVAEERLIAATGQPELIEVYCVEHGRWALRSAEQSVAVLGALVDDPVAAPALAAKANSGKFAASAGYLNKDTRLAAQAGEGQQAVWHNVAAANAASSVQPDSGTFTQNYVDPQIAGRLEAYVEAISDPVAKQDRIVGVIVAVNGKVESVDVFESTPLFRKLWPKLLRSYALDAFHAADEESSGTTCEIADAGAFLREVMQANVEEKKLTDGGLLVTRHGTDNAVSFSAEDASLGGAMGGAGGFGGGFGGSVHSAGFSRK